MDEESRADQLRKSRHASREQTSKNAEAGTPQKEKIGGVGFWILFAFVLVGEVVVIVLDFTVVGSLLTFIINPFLVFIVWFYFAMQGVSFSEKKLGVLLVTATVSFIPILNLLPESLINMLIIRQIENEERG